MTLIFFLIGCTVGQMPKNKFHELLNKYKIHVDAAKFYQVFSIGKKDFNAEFEPSDKAAALNFLKRKTQETRFAIITLPVSNTNLKNYFGKPNFITPLVNALAKGYRNFPFKRPLISEQIAIDYFKKYYHMTDDLFNKLMAFTGVAGYTLDGKYYLDLIHCVEVEEVLLAERQIEKWH